MASEACASAPQDVMNTMLMEVLPAGQITRRVACRLSPLQRQLYLDILSRNFDSINARASSKNSLSNALMNLRKVLLNPA